MVHEVRTIAFDLFGTGNGTEDDFCKAALREGPICDASYDLKAVFDNGQRPVIAVENL